MQTMPLDVKNKGKPYKVIPSFKVKYLLTFNRIE
jgi:hypothetical protein